MFIVFDLETTCWDGNPPTDIREVIEIGALRLDRFGQVVGRFNRFVRPTHFPMLSPFCKKLTSISQIDVNRSATFERAIKEFYDWIRPEDDEYLLCAWGNFDQKQLMRECEMHHFDGFWLEPYINIKKQYHRLRKLKHTYGLKSTVQREGFEFEGHHHRAEWDALNLAKIVSKFVDEWMF